MKILVTSYVYAPSVGGIETVSRLLAEAFAARGHEVEVLTETTAPKDFNDTLPTVRAPGLAAIWRAVGRADVVWQNNISLKYLWACLLQGKPVAVTLATALYRHHPRKGLRERLKVLLLRTCKVLAISRYVVNDSGLPYELVGNPFESSIRENTRSVTKDHDIVFVGRLVSDKGADLLLEALAALSEEGLNPTCTIIGDGPEKSNLEARSKALGLDGQIRFTGYLQGRTLHEAIARHHLMAVPSRWKEPFGVVALEGIAAGCVVVGSSGGGLSDAIGPCGVTFANNDSQALARELKQLLQHPQRWSDFTSHADAHLARFSIDAQCETYLSIFEKLNKN